jgi:hypothetical protein
MPDAICWACLCPFTREDWPVRHTDHQGEDIHADCCARMGPCSDDD